MKRPPGPRGLPLIGNAGQASRGLLEFFTENARRYGDVVYFEIANESFYQLNHPDDVEAVLVDDSGTFVKGRLNQEVLAPVVGTGSFTSEGAAWRDRRRRIEPSFQPERIADYGDVVTGRTDRLLEEWSDAGQVDVHEAMKELAIEIDARALLGIDLRRDVRAIGRNLDVVLGYIDSIPNLLLPSWAPTPGNRRFKRAISELESIVERAIDERRSESGGADVLSRLIATADERGEPMTSRQLRDEAMTFLLAGPGTTAVTLTYACYLLATHPLVEQHLVEELATVLDGDRPSAEVVSELTFTEQVITETMRLFPPTNRIHREPTDDVVVGGHQIPAGGNLLLPQWVVHRDPRWYPDPLAFYPERWTDEFRAGLPRLAYFPFGEGPRRCVGDRFAHLEATLVLATALQRYHLELPPEATLEVEAAVNTRPTRPVRMNVHERATLASDGGRGPDVT